VQRCCRGDCVAGSEVQLQAAAAEVQRYKGALHRCRGGAAVLLQVIDNVIVQVQRWCRGQRRSRGGPELVQRFCSELVQVQRCRPEVSRGV
jgi:hypothetical protein